MNKVNMGKNKSLVSYISTKIDLKSTLFILMLCQSVRYCIIEKINFVVKFYVVCGILNFYKFFNDFHIP